MIYLFDWNKVSCQQMQLQGTVSILIFSSIAWQFVKEYYFDLTIAHSDMGISLHYQVC